jgi:hypothetical protein
VRGARTGRLLKRLSAATGEKPLVKDVELPDEPGGRRPLFGDAPGATFRSTDLTAWSRAARVRVGRALTGAEAHRFDTGDPLSCSP